MQDNNFIEAKENEKTDETPQIEENEQVDEASTENTESAGESNAEAESPDYERLASEDLSEIKRLFPNLSSLSDIRELDNVARFGELRDSGLSVKEAFIATNFNRILASLAEKAARSDGKSHLRSAIPSVSAPPVNSMSAEQLHSAREIFGNLTDKEIENLYKRVSL
jgi:hypothetical protein